MAYVINYHYASHIGKHRKDNQDNLFCDGQYLECRNVGTGRIEQGRQVSSKASVFGVFDGMGGEECGEIASYIAAKELSGFVFDKDVKKGLELFCRHTNAMICQYIAENNLLSMGTTAAILKFVRGKIYLCNVGDSKIFQLSEGGLKQISYDHIGVSVFGKKPPLSQNLGIPESEMIISPYIATGECHNGDVYLICSDGLTDMLAVSDIEKILLEQKEAAAEELLKRALDNGGKDNITFILLSIEKIKNKFFNFNN